jgi:hypothetical protein
MAKVVLKDLQKKKKYPHLELNLQGKILGEAGFKRVFGMQLAPKGKVS